MPSLATLYSLVGCTVLRNEARWLPEWLEFHTMPAVGFQHFFLYDDASTDTLAQAVEPHVRRHLVTLHANFSPSPVVSRCVVCASASERVESCILRKPLPARHALALPRR